MQSLRIQLNHLGLLVLPKTIIVNSTMNFNIESSKEVGVKLAAKAKKKGIKEVLFDRGGYLYHGKIKSFAEGAREGGLIF